MAGTNYVFNMGSGTAGSTFAYYDSQFPTDGMYWYGSRVGFRDLTDGSSNTLMVSEALLGPGTANVTSATPPEGVPLRHYVGLNTGTFGANSSAPGGWNKGGLVTSRPGECDSGSRVWTTNRGNTWFWGGRDWNVVFNTALKPNDPLPDCGAHGRGYFGTRSLHTGGVNVVMCDGSVRFVSNTVDVATWQGASTRGGGETASNW